MKIKMKRLFGVLLSFMLVQGLVPGLSLVVRADSPHTHNNITFAAWDSADSLPSVEGSYYLTQDVTINSTWNVSGTTNLCLNGHGIRYTGNDKASVITVGSGVTLNLYDCDTVSKHYITLDENGRGTAVADAGTVNENCIEIIGGYITGGTGSQNDYDSYGGGIYNTSGTLTMYGGTIIGNTATHGGGVYNDNESTFNMEGGTVKSNTAKFDYGGGIFNRGTFTMNGGTICDNTVTGADTYCYGGGVHNNGPFTMNGGVICGNKANGGGGVFCNGGNFIMNGGTIESNDATKNYGGGVLLFSTASFTMKGGLIQNNTALLIGGGVLVNVSASFNISGNSKITGNTVNNNFNNVYLLNDKKINIEGALDNVSSIGVTMDTPGVFTNGLSGKGSNSNFTSDNDGYIVTLTGEGEAQLVQGYTVTYKVVNGTWLDGTTADKTEAVVSGAYPSSVPTGMIAASGYTGGSWDTDPSTIAIAGNTTFTYTFSADSSSSGGSTDSGSSSGGSSDSGSSDTSGETSGSSTGDGYIKDITGTAEANAENNTFEPKIVNNSELKTLLSITDAEVAEGVNVWLDIQDIGASVPQADKMLVQNASGDYTVGMYLDINLFKKVGSNAATKITETNGKIKASIVIPETLWKSGRTFELIRVHDGEAAVISGTYDENTHVFTFETDKFSTYALAYKDADSSSDSSSSTDSNSSSSSSNSTETTAPKTGDPNDIRVWYLLLIASLGGLGFIGYSKKKRVNE